MIGLSLLGQYWPVVACSCVFFQVFGAVFRRWLPHGLAKDDADLREFSGRAASSVHALVALCGAALALLSPSDIHRDHLFGASHASSVVVAISCGYFLHDTIDCLMVFEKKNIPFLMHHVMGVILYGLALAPLLQYWGAMLLTWEASTPLMNARWAFIKLKLTQHPAFQYIQLCFAFTFIAVRNVAGIIMSYHIWVELLPWCLPSHASKTSLVQVQNPLYDSARPLHPVVPGLFLAFNVLFNLLNAMWGWQIVSKAVAIFILPSKSKSQKDD
ncbi:TLC domain-containing protein [Plasmodiophora brassicae]